MKSYLIDEISSEDMKRIREELNNRGLSSELQDIFWVEMDMELLSEAQPLHKHCAPHVFALELSPHSVKLEFLVRSLKDMSCSCNAVFTPPQMRFAMHYVDLLFEKLGVRT
jgi:hypothetical protein